MKRLQAFKYELVPNGEQQRDMRRFAGSCRFVYNKALALQKQNYEAGNKFIGYVPMAASGLGRIQASTGLQGGLEWRHTACRTAAQHQSHLSVLQPYIERQSAYAGNIRVCGLWLWK